MADITDPIAVAFVKLLVRPRCDLLAHLIIEANRLVTVWDAQDLGDLIPATDDLVIEADTSLPGSPAPTLRPMSANDVNNVITLFRGIVAASEANGRAQIRIVVKGAANP